MIKVLFICHGNICRSTMSESVLTHLVTQRNLTHQFEISSAATSREEIGNPPHYGTVAKLRQVGIPVVPHRAVQMTKTDYTYYDYLIGMDTANIRNMNRIAGGDPDNKIYKLLSFANSGRDIADPWYTGNFDETYADVQEGCEAFLDYLQKSGEI
ncbi:MAG: low molecular weight phosphotyrosine protein phosphatase [Lachnospiraceae bacterium]|nr:low molecular weight phosphotyrosine protein phosphatase [Lachnospiraceae bacterium]